MESYVRSFTRGDTGTEFVYSSPYEWDRDIGPEELTHRIPSGDLSGASGEYQADSFASPRIVGIKGTLIAASPSDLQSKLDTLMGAHPIGKQGKLRRKIMDGATVVSDRYLSCRVAYRTKGAESGLSYNQWQIGFRAASPFYADWTAQSAIALSTTGGATSVTLGGTENAQPIITLVVSNAGRVTVSEAAFGNSITLAVVVGTYVIDSEQGLITVDTGSGPVPALTAITAGSWFDIAPYAHNVTTALASSATLTSASLVARRRWSMT